MRKACQVLLDRSKSEPSQAHPCAVVRAYQCLSVLISASLAWPCLLASHDPNLLCPSWSESASPTRLVSRICTEQEKHTLAKAPVVFGHERSRCLRAGSSRRRACRVELLRIAGYQSVDTCLWKTGLSGAVAATECAGSAAGFCACVRDHVCGEIAMAKCCARSRIRAALRLARRPKRLSLAFRRSPRCSQQNSTAVDCCCGARASRAV